MVCSMLLDQVSAHFRSMNPLYEGAPTRQGGHEVVALSPHDSSAAFDLKLPTEFGACCRNFKSAALGICGYERNAIAHVAPYELISISIYASASERRGEHASPRAIFSAIFFGVVIQRCHITVTNERGETLAIRVRIVTG